MFSVLGEILISVVNFWQSSKFGVWEWWCYVWFPVLVEFRRSWVLGIIVGLSTVAGIAVAAGGLFFWVLL